MGGVQTARGLPDGAPTWSADRLGLRVRLPGRASALAPAIDIGCVLVVVVSVLVVGIVEGLGLSHRLESLGDLAAAALLAMVVLSLVRGGAVIRLPYLAMAYVGVVAIAALRADGLVRLAVSGHNFLFYQALALGLAALGPRERRNRAVLLTVVALMVVEFAITIVQAPIVRGVDQVVGTFGNYATSTLLLAIVTGACLAMGVYAAGTGGRWWLALGAILPLCSIWGATRSSLLIVPAAAGAICSATWWISRKSSDRRKRFGRPRLIAMTFLAVPAMILAAYAVADPSYLTFHHIRTRLFGSSESFSAVSSAGGLSRSTATSQPAGATVTTNNYRIAPGATISRATHHGPHRAGFISVRTRQLWQGVDYATPKLRAGVPYRISAYVKGSTGDPVQLIVGDSVFSPGSRNISPTGRWSHYSFPYTPARTGKTGVAVRIEKTGQSRFYVDAVRVGDRPTTLGTPLPGGAPDHEEVVTAPSDRILPGATITQLRRPGGIAAGYVEVRTGDRAFEGVDYTTTRLKAGASYPVSGYVRGQPGQYVQLIIGDSTFGPGSEDIRTTANWTRYSFEYSPGHSGKTGVAVRTVGPRTSQFFVKGIHVAGQRAALGSPPIGGEPRVLPSVHAQYQAAERVINGSVPSLLFGEGLGTSTYARNLGVKPTQRDARWAAYSDFGSLLVELGWVGVAVVATCALALGLGSVAAAKRAPPGSWTRALLLAYPGVLVATTAAALYGNPFRDVGSATIFWVLTGLVLASILEQRHRVEP